MPCGVRECETTMARRGDVLRWCALDVFVNVNIIFKRPGLFLRVTLFLNFYIHVRFVQFTGITALLFYAVHGQIGTLFQHPGVGSGIRVDGNTYAGAYMEFLCPCWKRFLKGIKYFQGDFVRVLCRSLFRAAVLEIHLHPSGQLYRFFAMNQ